MAIYLITALATAGKYYLRSVFGLFTGKQAKNVYSLPASSL
jgi:hypothetical protein